jgi:hypothetical protein
MYKLKNTSVKVFVVGIEQKVKLSKRFLKVTIQSEPKLGKQFKRFPKSKIERL